MKGKGLDKLVALLLRKNGRKKNLNPKKIEFKNISKSNLFFFLGISVFISGFYFYGIGRSRYITSSDVVLRKSNSDSLQSVTLNSLFSSGNSGSIEDSRYLQSYLNSPQVLNDLEKDFPFGEKYKRTFPDLLSGLGANPTKEEKYNFYQKQISIILNDISGIITINTFAFDPKSSFQLNEYLIKKAEEFTNQLNQDVCKEQYKFAQKEVKKNLEKFNKAGQELENFQLKNKSLDLSNDALSTSNLISTLESKLAEKKVELATLRRKFLKTDAPEIIEVEALVDEIKNLIKIERQLLVSPNGKNLNKKVMLLNKLKSKLAFEENLYNSALATVESTRINSLQQQRFLANLSDPFEAEEEYNYWRHRGFLTIISIFIITFFLLRFILGLSEDHFDD